MLVRDLLPSPTKTAFDDIDVTRIDIDSRSCEAGSLFFALNGTQERGSRYVVDAQSRGAVAIIASEPVSCDIPVLVVPEESIYSMMVRASYAIVGNLDDVRLVGVTGTNGKTSVTHFVAQLLNSLGVSASTIGTLNNVRTTPSAPELARLLRSTRDEWGHGGVVAMEVSSHALDQDRIANLVFDVAVFTNLSQDHLDYHETMENYFAAKMRLFDGMRSTRAVVCVDDEWGQRLAEILPDCVTVARTALGDVRISEDSLSFLWRDHLVSANVGSSFNVINVALACEAVRALGYGVDDIATATRSLRNVSGRFEVVSRSPLVVVDYAHTPDGLERVLRDVATRAIGRVIVVFGCGGDRDRGKRPLMGAVASELADLIVITNDNPRSEDPREIADAIASGCSNDTEQHVILDRREAISFALALASPGDVVVIAGKGHEKTQETKGFVVDFDDVAVAQELLGK